MSLQNQSQNQNYGSQKLSKRTKYHKESIDFCNIGGLDNHLRTLREVIIIPLLHSNVFAHFHIKAPRGVLFYGPPGTGKTLVAAALATEINREGIGKVAFFERKGADILDKWVGGSEKNLRDLFDKATKSRPSIIFFDELDGLAPIRDKQMDHIHSSVVATLLALMDGLDNKPGLIVIGATNRIEAVDPALRRPGRFDKELYFPLPGVEARREILEVHTSTWKHKPTIKVINSLIESTSGYSGADLQALCSEAIIRCMKRSYPCLQNIKVDPETLKVEECDFLNAKLGLVPSSLKTGNKMRKLSVIVQPLLEEQLKKIVKSIETFWPHFLKENFRYVVGQERYTGKVLLIGNNMQGLNTHLVPAVLQRLEYLPVLIYDITKIFKKISLQHTNNHMPSVILLSKVDEWWNFIDECEQLSIVSSLEEIHAGLPVLVIATCRKDVPFMLHNFFYNNSSILLKIENPKDEERKAFFKPLFFDRNILSVRSVFRNLKLLSSKQELQSPRRSGRNVKPLVLLAKSKRKRDHSEHSSLRKRLKMAESRKGLVKSNSISSLYDMHKEIKKEKHVEPRKCGSLTGVSSYEPSQYFTKILSELLNQRNASLNASNANQVQALMQNRNLRLEDPDPVPDDYSICGEQMRYIYDLWRHVALVTSKNMAVAQLELLYDVISACINIHWNSFEALMKNLKDILNNIEKSYISCDAE